jgi:type II secretory pathway predicted ATPase ExeA
MRALKALLRAHGQTQESLARAVGISRPTLSQIINHGIWPTRPEKKHLADRLREVLVGYGIQSRQLDTVGLGSTPPPRSNPVSPPIEDIAMLLRKQQLLPTTRKHFALPRDPFGEIHSAEEVFVSPEVRYVRAALAQVATSETFLAIVGESGAGKSTLRRDLVDRIGRDNLPVVVIEPYMQGSEDTEAKGKPLRATDIAAAIIRTIDPMATIRQTAEARFAQLHRVLRDSRRAGNRHVLIMEEAHTLSIWTLKQLKRIYELEDGFQRLLSIVLIGQTELGLKLAENRPDVREVVQRCEVVYLDPLDAHLEEYLQHRLQRVGKALPEIIDRSGLEALRDRLTVPARDRRQCEVSLLYPLAVGNQLIAALNLAADLGAPVVTADIIRSL